MTAKQEVFASDGSDIFQFVCFRLGTEEYALNIMCVKEIMKVKPITSVPQMTDFTLGVLNVRGDIIPVFDLRKKFHLPEKPFDSLSRIVVANTEKFIIAFVVDEVLENIRFDITQIDPAPPVKMKIDRSCILGIGELVDRMIIILNLEKIHEEIMEEIYSVT